MFNYRTVSISAFVILILLIILNLFLDIGFVPYLVLVVLCNFIIFYGSAFVNSGFYFNMLCSVKTHEKVFALSFDDGPSSATPLILDVLKSYDVQAMFFVIGERAIKNEKMIMRIYEEGHLIGNHSYSHRNFFPLYSAKKILNELRMTEDIIEKIIGKKVHTFRPPFGVTNPSIGKAVRRAGYMSVGWSLKSRDTVIEDGHKIAERINRKLKPGDIILFHDLKENTASALKKVLEFAVQNNYKVLRLDELLNINPYN